GRVGPAEGDQDSANAAVTHPGLRSRGCKLRPEQGVLRTQHQLALPRNQAIVAALRSRMQVLVQQQIAVVDPIGEIVDYENDAGVWAQSRLPPAVESVMV